MRRVSKSGFVPSARTARAKRRRTPQGKKTAEGGKTIRPFDLPGGGERGQEEIGNPAYFWQERSQGEMQMNGYLKLKESQLQKLL